MLTNGGDVEGLLEEVKEVVMSSRVNLSLLVDHINSLPNNHYHPDPNLKFRILYGGSTCAAPKIKEHVPSSFFSVEMSTAHLKSLNGVLPLRKKVDSIFKRKLGIFAEILAGAEVDVHETLLYHILPFLWGGKISEGVLKEVVAYVGALLGESKIVSTNKRVEELEAKVQEAERENEAMKRENETMKREIGEIKALLEEVVGKGRTGSTSGGARRSARKRGRKSGT